MYHLLWMGLSKGARDPSEHPIGKYSEINSVKSYNYCQ